MHALPGDKKHSLSAATPRRDIIDYILAKAEEVRLSIRQIGTLADIRRSRCGRVLHCNSDKRCAIRYDEIIRILSVLGIDPLEVALADEAWSEVEAGYNTSDNTVITLVCEVMRGLPRKIMEIVDGIEGLEYEDVRKEHGEHLQATIVRFINDQYTQLAKRREYRVRQVQIR